MTIIPQITCADVFGLACALRGKDWQAHISTPWLYAIVENALSAGPDGVKKFQASLPLIIGNAAVIEVFQTDTDAPAPERPPEAPPAHDDFADVPDLPATTRLTAAQERQAEQVGQFERHYQAWASATANQTPTAYHQGIAICLIATAIGRRCYVAAPWAQLIFPNQFAVLLGTTTYHRKSTALNLMQNIVEAAFPHLLMPRPGSAENFSNMLAGRWDTEGLPPDDRAELERARPFAGQRLILRDEISGLFRSFGRDYMAGLKEDLMAMYESPRSHKLSTNSRGIVIAREISPSMIGASTPAGMTAALSVADWRDGNLARFVLITPEPDYRDRPRPRENVQPDEFIEALRGLHERLPAPPAPGMGQAESWSLIADIWDEAQNYGDALRQMTNPQRADALDDRLRGTYGRHHVKALKVAVSLAVMDWHQGNPTTERPKVTKAHWYRAQQIAEGWRASAHRFLQELSMSEDAESEGRIIAHLRRYPEGETKTDLVNRTGLQRNAVADALASLVEAGKVEIRKARRGTRGPEATLYCAV